MCSSGQKITSRRNNPPHTKDRSGKNLNAKPPLDISRDYILFNSTCLAAATKKAKLQQSLQNQSTSVLTAPSGLDFSTLSDTLPQPGEVISFCVLLYKDIDDLSTIYFTILHHNNHVS